MPTENSTIRRLSTSSSKHEPLLRLSLFQNIPPFVRFYAQNSDAKTRPAVKKPPNNCRDCFKWRKTTLLSNIMKRTLKQSHFELVPETGRGKHLYTAEYRLLKCWQRVNHLPGDFHIGRKDRLWMHLVESGWPDIMPFTFVLPKDLIALREYMESNKKYLILKPPASARGRGIQIVSSIDDVPLDTPLIAQKYIDALTLNGAKFDLRLYVYVASIDPLRIYLYKDGLVRFASVPMTENAYDNMYMHLTNYSINKLAKKNGVLDIGVTDLKWPIAKFREFVLSQGRCWTSLWEKIVDVSIKSIIACHSQILRQQANYPEFPFLNRELFGMDVILDKDYEPYILEMNISPSMQTGTAEDTAVKAPLISDCLNMWRMEYSIDDDLEAADLSYRSKADPRPQKEGENLNFYLNTEKISPAILTHLTDADIRYLIDFEDEFALRGNFDLIFPAPETVARYLPAMEATYANLLLTAWISLADEDRRIGVERLKSAAAMGAHLSEVDGDANDSTASTETEETSGIVDV
ncbi:Tubulin-tyrosine ligase [Aphelenchoides fujianensis]|nr:Tubulin-tyrosine ligase [Aphelenchoides fujianensis]